MRRPDFIARQSAGPSGIVGRIVATVMERETMYVNQHVVDLLEIEKGDCVLDVGSGNGPSLRHIAERVGAGLAVGVDHSAVMCQRARKNNAALITAERVQVKHAASDELPFESGTFDAAMGVHTMYFWDPAQPHLCEIARVLRPGGRLVLAFRPADTAGTGDFTSTVYRFRSTQEIEDLVAACGFEVLACEHPFGPDDPVAILWATRDHASE